MRTNFEKEKTLKILFSDEKLFDIDSIYSSQNEKAWAVDRADADKKRWYEAETKISTKVMVWVDVCSQGITPLVTLDEETVNYMRYIEKLSPVALKYGNKVLGNDWVFQQDGVKAHQYFLTHQWYRNNFPSFIDKDL